MQLKIYLNFNGNAEEAINFYVKALNKNVPKMLRFGDLPPNEELPYKIDDVKNLILHSEISIGESAIMCSDIMPGMELNKGNNMSVTLNFDTIEEIELVYKNLSKDAISVLMPLGEAMWAKRYAYFVDKFGVPWQLNYFGGVEF